MASTSSTRYDQIVIGAGGLGPPPRIG